jgi:predicted dehydrogenase
LLPGFLGQADTVLPGDGAAQLDGVVENLRHCLLHARHFGRDGRTFLTRDYRELLDRDEIEILYVAVPHNLHAKIYGEVLEAGKDLMAEKPFGIDLAAAEQIAAAAQSTKRFVRCSSEFPFLPGPQRAIQTIRSGQLGRVLEVTSGFHHSSDLDPTKTVNWKRQSAVCGEIGVLGDLGMHACHVLLRLGWLPTRLFAQLQKGYPERPDGKGGKAACDTWDNALLHTWTTIEGEQVRSARSQFGLCDSKAYS